MAILDISQLLSKNAKPALTATPLLSVLEALDEAHFFVQGTAAAEGVYVV